MTEALSMDGLILVLKPFELTSHDIVEKIRKISGTSKVGHYGTLDPFATGLILIALGKATRLFPFFAKTDKEYTGHIRLGFATDTYDFTGQPTTKKVMEYPKSETLIQAMTELTGTYDQLPPAFSAKKYKGKPLYVFARKKIPVPLKAKEVTVMRFDLNAYKPPLVEFEVGCSSGTYIRSLSHDLGQKLGCGAHLEQLERTAVGTYSISESHELEEIFKCAQTEKMDDVVIPMESLLPELPKIILNEPGAGLARNGNMITYEHAVKFVQETSSLPDGAKKHYRLFSPEGKFVAIAKETEEPGMLHPFLVLDSK